MENKAKRKWKSAGKIRIMGCMPCYLYWEWNREKQRRSWKKELKKRERLKISPLVNHSITLCLRMQTICKAEVYGPRKYCAIAPAIYCINDSDASSFHPFLCVCVCCKCERLQRNHIRVFVVGIIETYIRAHTHKRFRLNAEERKYDASDKLWTVSYPSFLIGKIIFRSVNSFFVQLASQPTSVACFFLLHSNSPTCL